MENLKPKDKVPEPVTIKLPKVNPPKVESTRFTTLQIVKDNDVTDLPPVVDKLAEAQIGLSTQVGTKDEGFVAPPVEQSTGIAEVPKKADKDYDAIFTKVEKEAKFPGGMEAWKKYLERNLNANVAADDGAAMGNYTVKVQLSTMKQ